MTPHAAYQKERKIRLQTAGLCIRCRRPRGSSRSAIHCETCADRHRDDARRNGGHLPWDEAKAAGLLGRPPLHTS